MTIEGLQWFVILLLVIASIIDHLRINRLEEILLGVLEREINDHRVRVADSSDSRAS